MRTHMVGLSSEPRLKVGTGANFRRLSDQCHYKWLDSPEDEVFFLERSGYLGPDHSGTACVDDKVGSVWHEEYLSDTWGL